MIRWPDAARIPRASAAVALITGIAFLRCLQGDFLDWDDQSNLVHNPYYRGFGWSQLRWMFGLNSVHYYPLTWLSFSLDHALWGLRPWGFHLTNIVLHAANAALFFRLCLRLFEKAGLGPHRIVGAALAALIFSLHPLRVEVVAWITERSLLLSTLFLLAALLAYVERWMTLSLALYAASLGAKASGAPLAAVLLVLDAYLLRHLELPWRRLLAEKLPFAALGAAAAGMTLLAQSRIGAPWPMSQWGFGQRLAVAAYNAAFYLGKSLCPLGLMPLYPMPRSLDPLAPAFLASAALFAAMTWLAWRLRRRAPAFGASWLCYLLFLLPVAGIVQTGPQFAADRYSYLACLGWAALAGGWLSQRFLGPSLLILGAFLLLPLAAATWRQSAVWRNSEIFWTYQAEADPSHAPARNYLGDLRARQGRPASAETLLREAVALDPCYGAALNNLGNLLANTGRLEEAAAQYRRAIVCAPGHAVARHNLGLALRRLGRLAEAERTFEEEMRIVPGAAATRRALEEVQAARRR